MVAVPCIQLKGSSNLDKETHNRSGSSCYTGSE